MACTSKPIASASFYGEDRSQLSECSNPLPATEPAFPPYLSDPLLGPSKVWKIFRKQQEALDFIASHKLEGELLPFSFESINHERLFFVAHPDVFWFRDCLKKPHLRNTYEIISKDAISKLYFDIEFDPTLEENKTCEGNDMVTAFIRVVLYYMRKLFGVRYKMKDVLILDSSTERKFSVHLIFQTPLVFKTNLDAGNFVKYIANELVNINNVCSDEEQLAFDIFKETTINIYAIKDLFVTNSKQARSLFVDLAVYSKNRLFRLYQSTKQDRNSPLVLSPINKFSLAGTPFDCGDPVQYERGIFLSSLVTYFREPPDPKMVKEFEKPLLNPNYSSEANLRIMEKLHSGRISPTKTSPYPALDDYIRTRIQPKGSIYRNVHFPSTNVTVYDIKGYRYCGNIGRWHKSQNIKLIADVGRGVYYQKCHDIECASYKSPEWPLPPEILFKIQNDEGDSLLENVLEALDGPREGNFQAVCMESLVNCETPSIKKEETCEPPCIGVNMICDTTRVKQEENCQAISFGVSNHNESSCEALRKEEEKSETPLRNEIVECDIVKSEPNDNVERIVKIETEEPAQGSVIINDATYVLERNTLENVTSVENEPEVSNVAQKSGDDTKVLSSCSNTSEHPLIKSKDITSSHRIHTETKRYDKSHKELENTSDTHLDKMCLRKQARVVSDIKKIETSENCNQKLENLTDSKGICSKNCDLSQTKSDPMRGQLSNSDTNVSNNQQSLSNGQKSVSSNQRSIQNSQNLLNCEMLPVTIVDKTDQEMVLDYVRNCEKRLASQTIRNCDKQLASQSSRFCGEKLTSQSCKKIASQEPVVKKIKL